MVVKEGGNSSPLRPLRTLRPGVKPACSSLNAGGAGVPLFACLSPWAFSPRNPMKNGHNNALSPIRAIPFVFSKGSILTLGFSTLRRLLIRRGAYIMTKRVVTDAPPVPAPYLTPFLPN